MKDKLQDQLTLLDSAYPRFEMRQETTQYVNGVIPPQHSLPPP